MENNILFKRLISPQGLGCLICIVNFFLVSRLDAAAAKKRDPFIPLVTPEGRLLQPLNPAPEGDLRLEGLIYDDNGSSLAIVNGAVARIGDTVCGYRVIKIEQDKVLFMKDGQMTEISFKQKKKEGPPDEDPKN